MASLRFQPDAFARSDACIAIGAALSLFAGYTFYRVLFDPPPWCDHLCGLITLWPTFISLLWLIWLMAWHLPHWQDLSRTRRWSLAGLAFAACAFMTVFMSW